MHRRSGRRITSVHRCVNRRTMIVMVMMVKVFPMVITPSADVVQLAHVLLQVKVTAKSLCADFAREGFLIVVRMHVKGKIVHLMESLVAYVALVSFVAAVRQLVVLVVALLVESFAAKFAYKRLVASMNSSMRV